MTRSQPSGCLAPALLMLAMSVVGVLIGTFGHEVAFWLSLRPWWWLGTAALVLIVLATAIVVAYTLLRPLNPDRLLPPVPPVRGLDELPELTDAARKRRARTETVLAVAFVLMAPAVILLDL